MEEKPIRIISEKISITELKKIAEERYGDLVKAVVDVEKKIMALGGEMHADEEEILLEQGSKQANLWGINLYPCAPEEKMIEFDSIINLRAWQNNRSRGVEDPETKKIIIEVVRQLIYV